MNNYGDIASAALVLLESDRLDLAILLLESVEDAPDEDVENAWREEIRRRAELADRDRTLGTPWSEVKAELLAQARCHG